MIDIKPGDWVLAEHPVFRDAWTVYEVVRITAKSALFRVAEADGDGVRKEATRRRNCVLAVFPDEATARAAVQPLRNIHAELISDERQLRRKAFIDAMALAGPR